MESKMLSKKPRNKDFIPDEITEDILTRLPVKSLSRFKCVSKPWLSLISSQTFVKKHLDISSISPRLMCFYDEGVEHCSANSLISGSVTTEMVNINFPDTNTNKPVSRVGSCNGLVCFSIGNEADDDDYFIWNPSTRIFKMLPHIEEKIGWIGKRSEFVYNSVDDDYKVLRIYIEDYQMDVDVYSLRGNSWKSCTFVDDGISPYSELVSFGGKILISTGTETTHVYGIESDDDGIESDDDGIENGVYVLKVENIVSFDLESDVHEIIEQPDYGEGVKVLLLEEVGGCFGLVCKKETHADLWVMKEYGVKDSWCKILTVSFSDDLPKEVDMKPLIMFQSEEILPLIMLPSSWEFEEVFEARLEVYNLKTNDRRVVDTSNFSGFLLTFIYVESLVSPTQFD